MRLAHDLVPVPQKLHRGENYSVFSFLDGDFLESISQHSRAVIDALAKVLSVELRGPGWINADGSMSSFPFGGACGFISESLDKAEIQA